MTHRWLILLGFVVSLGFVVLLLARIDWPVFRQALLSIRLIWVAATCIAVVCGVLVRALRWNLLATQSLRQYSHFWRAVNIGYLGNLIYPLRAGEAMRIFVIHRFAGVPAAQAIASALFDRLADVGLLALFALVVLLGQRQQALGAPAVLGLFVVVLLALGGIVAFARWGEQWLPYLQRLLARRPVALQTRLRTEYLRLWQSTQLFQQPKQLFLLFVIDLVIFLCDYAGIWAMMLAFSWSLPFVAAITVGVFIAAGTSLPSAPAYLGVYQVACILALAIYGVGESNAIAYALVLQLFTALPLLAQGLWAMFSYGITPAYLTKTQEIALQN